MIIGEFALQTNLEASLQSMQINTLLSDLYYLCGISPNTAAGVGVLSMG
jgi:hypothetical protein